MRTPITLKIKFKSSNLEQFIERYSVDVSRGGIFIRTKEPLPVGTQLRFEFQLQDASSLITGDGTVVWIREYDPARTGAAPGMGVRFDKLQPESQRVLDRILVEKSKRGEAQLESRFDAGVRANAPPPAPVPARVQAHNDFGGGESKVNTPLPPATPGLSPFDEEFGEESTRVMQNELVQSLADRTRQGFEPEPTRKATSEELSGALAQTPPGGANVPAAIGNNVTPAGGVAVNAPAPVAVAGSGPNRRPTPPGSPAATPSPSGAHAAVKRPTPTGSPAPSGAHATVEPPRPAARNPFAAVDGTAPPSDQPMPAVAAPRIGEPRKRRVPAAVYLVIALAFVVGGYAVVRHSSDVPATPPAPTPAPPEAKKTEAPALPPPRVETPAGLAVPVTSDPPGASVTVDGAAQPKATPTTLTGLDPSRTYELRVALKGFHEWKVKLKPRPNDHVDAALVPTEKQVELTSMPEGAEVSLDGKHVGKTPLTLRKLDLTKARALEVKHAGFLPLARSISAGDAFETKGDKDVLPIALTLEVDPNAPKAQKRKKADKPADPAGDKPAADKADKPVDKAAEGADKPAVDKADKPAADKADKPASGDRDKADKPAADKADKPAASDKGDKPAEKAALPKLKAPPEPSESAPADKP